MINSNPNPESPMTEIETLIGHELTAQLQQHFGGQTIGIPENITPDHRISLSIGHAAAVKLSARMAGEVIY